MIAKFKFDLTKDASIKIVWVLRFVLFCGDSCNFLFLSFLVKVRLDFELKSFKCSIRALRVLTRSLEIGLSFVELNVISQLPLSKMIMQQTLEWFISKWKLSSLKIYFLSIHWYLHFFFQQHKTTSQWRILPVTVAVPVTCSHVPTRPKV